MPTRGVVIIAYGEASRREAGLAIESLRRHNELPVTVIGERVAGTDHMPFEAIGDGVACSRWAKVNLDRLSPFDETLYLDADTRPRGDVSAGFEVLESGWDVAVAPSTNQGGELLWHVGEEERQETLLAYGCEPLQLQAGVLFLSKGQRTLALFEAWRAEWQRYQGQDQAALLRALLASPARVWLLGRPWNGGALIDHLFGNVRRA